MNSLQLTFATLAAATFLTGVSAHAAAPGLIITEVDPTGSSTSTYGQDWFELTNFGGSAISLTGWKMDDNSNSFTLAVPLRGVTSINAGQSIVFVEDGTNASNDAALDATFKSAWFGSNVPAGFTIANYGGSGVGLGATAPGDAVNIFDSAGTLQAGVSFGAAVNNVTFDNSILKITNTFSTDGTIATTSVAGVNGAFTDAAGEVGSPGAVPEPNSVLLFSLAGALLAAFSWIRRRVCA